MSIQSMPCVADCFYRSLKRLGIKIRWAGMRCRRSCGLALGAWGMLVAAAGVALRSLGRLHAISS